MEPQRAFTVLVLSILVLAFATLVTTHVVLATSIGRRKPWWRGAVALVVVPLAPWWGWKGGMRGSSTLWIAAALVYCASLGLSFAG